MIYDIEIHRNGFTKAPGPEMFFLSDWEKEYELYTYVFILRGNGHTILIDTGCGDIEIINKMLSKEFGGKITFELPEEEKIESILKRSNLDPGEVDYVFISHLHHDHSSNVDLFPNAKVILSKKGWMEYMKKDRPYYYNDALFPTGPIKYIAGLDPKKIIFVEDEMEVLPTTISRSFLPMIFLNISSTAFLSETSVFMEYASLPRSFISDTVSCAFSGDET